MRTEVVDDDGASLMKAGPKSSQPLALGMYQKQQEESGALSWRSLASCATLTLDRFGLLVEDGLSR